MTTDSAPTAATDRIIGRAPAVRTLREQVVRLAAFDSVRSPHVPTILVCGETGTGKGLVARTLHDSGPRAVEAFIDVNCAAIPETMIEAELFGHEAGAFTDAKRAKPGLFEAAAGGTLFLDEIDSLALPLQGKLLKAIEEKRVRRLGAVEPIDVNVKLIAASQRDLAGEASAGRFRADLYHRLAVVVLPLPPLRERQEDLEQLATHYLGVYADAYGIAAPRLDSSAAEWLRTYDWPGNVRELSHLMERAILLCGGSTLDAGAIEGLRVPGGAPADATAGAAALAAAPPTEVEAPVGIQRPFESEADSIRDALARSGGNVARAARELGIGRNALRYRMKKLAIRRPDESAPVPLSARPTTTASAAQTSEPSAAQAAPMEHRSTEASPAVPSWQEKPAAVLVIEIVFPRDGSTPAGDPWTLANRWRQQIEERVGGFGGRLFQSSPARLSAFFGVPRALEQTPQRAVQAALAIRRVAEQRRSEGGAPELRFACHLGSVRFDAAAEEPIATLFPLGDTSALAERMVSHAAGGEVLVSGQIARRIQDSCLLEPRLLGLGSGAEAQEVHAVLGARSRPQRPAEASQAKFIGRRRELGFLRDSYRMACEGTGQVVFVVGDAGIGKSRLLQEFQQSTKDENALWIEGRCASYGSTAPFLPIADAANRYFGIDDRDDTTMALAKVDRKLADLGEELQWAKPFVCQLLSLSDEADLSRLDSASRRSEMFRALKAILLRETARRPVVLTIEDLHWIDPASEEFLVFLADTIPATRALLVCTHRPGYRHKLGDRSYHSRLPLNSLSKTDMADMATSVLGVTELAPSVQKLIARKAEGNPFFVEEISASLLEQGAVRRQGDRIVLAREADDIDVPDTIQDVLVARIDRLAEDARQAIQVAAIIGREFAMRLLERISDVGDGIQSRVQELRALELVYEKAMHPELAYMFKHALTHDVAYDSVPTMRREQLHRIIGTAIEELYRDRLAEHYETLAHHFELGADWQRAVRYHEMAADKAATRHANRAVAHHSQRALALGENQGETFTNEQRRTLELRLGLACFHSSEFVASGKAYERAAALTDGLDERADILTRAVLSYFWAHRYDACGRCLEQAKGLAAASDTTAVSSVITYLEGIYTGVTAGDIDGYTRACKQGFELETAAGQPAPAAVGGFVRSMVCEWKGEYREALEIAERGIAVGRELQLSHFIIWPMWFQGKALCCLGDLGGAITRLHEAADICERIGDVSWQSRLLNTLGWAYAEAGAVAHATLFNQRSAELAELIGDPEILANSKVNLALNSLAKDEPGQAADLIGPIRAFLDTPGDPWMRWRFALHVLDAEARLALAKGEADQALFLARQERAGAEKHRAPKLVVRALLTAATAEAMRDDREAARADLIAAITQSERISHPQGRWRALQLAAELDQRDAHVEDAARRRREARSLADQAAATLADEALRRGFLHQFE